MILIFIDFLIFDILKASFINRVEKNAVYERSFLSYHLGIVNWAHWLAKLMKAFLLMSDSTTHNHIGSSPWKSVQIIMLERMGRNSNKFLAMRNITLYIVGIVNWAQIISYGY